MAKIIPDVRQAGTKRSWRSMWRSALLVLVIVLVAGGAGVGARWLKERGSGQKPLAKLPKTVSDVQNLRLSGDADEANKKIDQQLSDQSLDSKLRYDLYIQKGHGLVEKEDYKGAIEAYKAADQLKATRETAWLIGDMYVRIEDKTQAIAYYNKAIERVPTDDPLADNDTEYLKNLVKNLEEGS